MRNQPWSQFSVNSLCSMGGIMSTCIHFSVPYMYTLCFYRFFDTAKPFCNKNE